ncbi:hypothetical protein [Pseudarthrobacter sp. efr-133-R2A-89]|uniref:hypothetical protein n=1 Tax=Pseudarthrobacter sp. efr-133-R2A-89 TaxID=3040302 RepID=UPI0025528D66|nr:hypothetical protein [Pseudarthrobacter sp. efr-133-R2A-89]
MGESEDLRALPEGWAWDGLAGPELAWMGDGFLKDPVGDTLPNGFTNSAWILHAQFFRPANEPAEPKPDDLDSMPGFGFGAHAPAGWQRITWAETASLKAVPVRGPAGGDGLEIPPCYRWEALLNDRDAGHVVHPGAQRDSSVWPTEGSLGKADLEALVPILAAHTVSTRMLGGRFAPITSLVNAEATRFFTFELATMLPSMLATGVQEFSPELWWPEDRAWVVWTDYDLMGTRVFGSTDLIVALKESHDIETLDWHRARLGPPAPPRPPSRLELRIQALLAKKEAERQQLNDGNGQG